MRAQLSQLPPAMLSLWSYLRLPVNLPSPGYTGTFLLCVHLARWSLYVLTSVKLYLSWETILCDWRTVSVLQEGREILNAQETVFLLGFPHSKVPVGCHSCIEPCKVNIDVPHVLLQISRPWAPQTSRGASEWHVHVPCSVPEAACF